MLTLEEWARTPRPPRWLWWALAVGAAWWLLRSAPAWAEGPCAATAQEQYAACWHADTICERKPRRAWKPCRKEVAACFRRADRCWGGWAR